MKNLSAIVHGMFLLQGAQSVGCNTLPNYDDVMADLGGEIGLAEKLATFAPIVAELETRCVNAGFEYPGVFEYEVTEQLGKWFIRHPACTTEQFTDTLNSMAASFFGRDVPPLVMNLTTFVKAYRKAVEASGSGYTVGDLAKSYRNYLADPAGHFISKVQS